MTKKNSFILYTEQKTVIDKLSDEQAGKLIKAIYEYAETGKMPELDNVLDLVIIPFKTVLDKNKENYEKICKARAEAGSKGGKQKKQLQTKASKSKQKKQLQTKDDDNDNEYDNDIKKEKNKKKKKVEEICLENHFSEELKNTLNDFIEMREKIKKPMTEKAIELLVRKLKKLADSEEKQIAILEQSIECCWQTIYPLKSISTEEHGKENEKEDVFKEIEIDTSELTNEEYSKLLKGEITIDELIERGRVYVG